VLRGAANMRLGDVRRAELEACLHSSGRGRGIASGVSIVTLTGATSATALIGFSGRLGFVANCWTGAYLVEATDGGKTRHAVRRSGAIYVDAASRVHATASGGRHGSTPGVGERSAGVRRLALDAAGLLTLFRRQC